MQGALTVSGGLRQQFDADLFRRFIDYTDVKETTLKGYAVCIRALARWASETGTKQTQREDIKDYKEYLETHNVTAGSRAQYLRAVQHFFKWTAAEGLYPNIADGIKGARAR